MIALLLGVQVVFEHAGDRPIIFSSFQPDAAQLIRKLQDKYPVSVTACDNHGCMMIEGISCFRTMNSEMTEPTLLPNCVVTRDQVFFLTNGGTQVYADPRRNSLEEAVKVCVAGGLQGIVSEVRAILRQPSEVAMIKEANKLSLMTYGQLK